MTLVISQVDRLVFNKAWDTVCFGTSKEVYDSIDQHIDDQLNMLIKDYIQNTVEEFIRER